MPRCRACTHKTKARRICDTEHLSPTLNKWYWLRFDPRGARHGRARSSRWWYRRWRKRRRNLHQLWFPPAGESWQNTATDRWKRIAPLRCKRRWGKSKVCICIRGSLNLMLWWCCGGVPTGVPTGLFILYIFCKGGGFERRFEDFSISAWTSNNFSLFTTTRCDLTTTTTREQQLSEDVKKTVRHIKIFQTYTHNTVGH